MSHQTLQNNLSSIFLSLWLHNFNVPNFLIFYASCCVDNESGSVISDARDDDLFSVSLGRFPYLAEPTLDFRSFGKSSDIEHFIMIQYFFLHQNEPTDFKQSNFHVNFQIRHIYVISNFYFIRTICFKLS